MRGIVPANPLRNIKRLPCPVAESRNKTRPDMIAIPVSLVRMSAGNDLRLIVGGSTEKAANPSQGSGNLEETRGSPLHSTNNACAAELVAFVKPRIP